MKIRIAVELRITRDQPDPDEGPTGTESLVIHQDQPRYIGFHTEETPE